MVLEILSVVLLKFIFIILKSDAVKGQNSKTLCTRVVCLTIFVTWSSCHLILLYGSWSQYLNKNRLEKVIHRRSCNKSLLVSESQAVFTVYQWMLLMCWQSRVRSTGSHFNGKWHCPGYLTALFNLLARLVVVNTAGGATFFRECHYIAFSSLNQKIGLMV